MKNKKLKIEDLLEKKGVKKHELFFDSEVLDARIEFERIDSGKILDILQDAKEEKITIHNANLYVIYLSVPMFRNAELQKKYEIKDSPYKVVDEIFENDVLEITGFADKILAIYGFGAERVNKIKKQ